MTTRAAIITRTAWLGSEFGESFARRIFGDAAVDATPRNSKGKNVGKFKATIEWVKVESGGWVSEGPATGNGGASGHVENRVGKIIAARLVLIPFGSSYPSEIFAEHYDTPRDQGSFRNN